MMQIDIEKTKKNFLNDFSKIRKNQNITQIELEKLSGVNQTVITRLENSISDPQLTTIFKILHSLGHTLAIVPFRKNI